MKKITKLLMLAGLAWSGQSQAQTIFFSEYGEGTSNNKYLEIYNPGSDTVNLSDYILGGCGNGCNTGGIKGTWQMTFMGVGPTKGDVSWYSTKIDANNRGCLADDEFVFHGNGSFQNKMGSQTWLEGWQGSTPDGCGTPVAPHDGSKMGTWKDNKNGTFTLYGKGSHVGLAKVYNNGELGNPNDAKDSIVYDYTMNGDSSMSVYCQIANGGYWQFDFVKTGITFEFNNTNMIAGNKLAPGEVYIMANSGAQANIKAKANFTGSQPSHTGNDYWVIMKASDGSFVDEIGEMTDEATEPANGWDVAGITEATKDHTLVRKPGKSMGSRWSVSAGTTAANSEWIVLDGPTATDIFGDLGTYKRSSKRTVKVSVDMQNETVSSNGVHVAGSFQGWSPNTTTLTQEGSSSIYSTYTEMDENSVVEYKFINNNDWAGAESVPAISQKGHKNNGESNDNRWVWTGAGSDTLVLPAFVFGKSAPAGQYAVRLAVDLQKEASVSTDGVHIAGNIQKAAGFPEWNPSATQMANLYNTNKIHEVILCVADGNYAYKFVNGNAWGKDESVPSACATDNNRAISVSGADVEASKVCFGSCDACPERAIPQFNATFQIDMGKECNFEKVDIAGGKINGWAGGDFLTDDNMDGIYTITVKLDSGVEIAHKVRKIDANGNVNWEGGSDRKYFVHNDTTFAVRCFGLDEPCSGATIAPSDITFQVDMSNEIPQDTVWVMGSFTSPAWQSGAIAMLPNADNADLYEVTVEKVCNEYFEYKFVNAIMSSSENGETYPDSTDRACLKDNGLGSFNRHHTRTSSDAVTIAYVYNSCAAPQGGNVTNISSEMRIAPNPASGMFTVSLGSRTIEKVIVMSLDGRTVRSENPANNRADVNVFGLTGVYLVQITDVDGNIATQKVVLQ